VADCFISGRIINGFGNGFFEDEIAKAVVLAYLFPSLFQAEATADRRLPLLSYRQWLLEK